MKRPAVYAAHLDAMRAMAAIVVFVLHGKGLFIGPLFSAQPSSTAVEPAVRADQYTNMTHEAVIVFFVLSGFLVGGGTIKAWKNGNWHWIDYALKRMSRLWIVLIPALIITLIFDSIGLTTFGMDNAYGRPHGELSISYGVVENLSVWNFIGCLFFLQKILVEPLGSNGALWTLSYEFWFYVAFPVCMALVMPKSSLKARILAGMGLMLISSFVGTQISIYFLIWVNGALLQVIPKYITKKYLNASIFASLLLFMVVSAALSWTKIYVVYADFIEGFFCSVLIYTLIHKTERSDGNIYSRISGTLSDMSYTIYLVHLPILTFMCAGFGYFGLVRSYSIVNVIAFSFSIVAAFGICWILYLLFERHTNSLRRKLHALLFNR